MPPHLRLLSTRLQETESKSSGFSQEREGVDDDSGGEVKKYEREGNEREGKKASRNSTRNLRFGCIFALSQHEEMRAGRKTLTKGRREKKMNDD